MCPMSLVLGELGMANRFQELIVQPDHMGWPVERRPKYMLGVFELRYETL